MKKILNLRIDEIDQQNNAFIINNVALWNPRKNEMTLCKALGLPDSEQRM